MTAVQRFRDALRAQQIDPLVLAQIFSEYETISDQSKKETRAAFFRQAITRMDALLPPETGQAVRDACACSKGGWRLKAVQKLAKQMDGKPLEEKLAALWEIPHLGRPVLNPDGSITAGIGEQGGFACPCPVFDGTANHEPVSITYCYCCAGHFRFHYQIALGVKLTTREVVSSALESQREKPCRFVYDIVK